MDCNPYMEVRRLSQVLVLGIHLISDIRQGLLVHSYTDQDS